MNCSTFRKKLFDYMEDNVVLDMKEAMDSHVRECEACRRIYEEEKSFDECLRDAFKVSEVNFTSSRSTIIKSIDKNKYSKNPVNKVNYHLKKFRFQYLSSAAVLALAFFMAPYVTSMLESPAGTKGNSDGDFGISSHGLSDNSEASNRFTAQNEPGNHKEDVKLESSDKMGVASKEMVPVKESYMPKFVRKDSVNYDLKSEWGTEWKASESGKYSVSVHGKGNDAGEEGVADILIMDNAKKAVRSLSMVEDGKQYSPMFAEWIDDENLLVIVGLGYGRVVTGGDLYLLNINTCKTTIIYETPNHMEEVVSVRKSRKSSILELEVKVYDDNIKNSYHIEQRIITFIEVSDRSLPEIKVVYDFSSAINRATYSEGMDYLTESFKSSHQSRIGNINNLRSMIIKKVLDITNQHTADRNVKDMYEYRIYYAQVQYKTDTNLSNTVKTGEYYQKIVTVRETKSSTWKIADIVNLPQS
jgi:hypothetical protein